MTTSRSDLRATLTAALATGPLDVDDLVSLVEHVAFVVHNGTIDRCAEAVEAGAGSLDLRAKKIPDGVSIYEVQS